MSQMKQKFRIITYHRDGKITYDFPWNGDSYSTLWVYAQNRLGLRVQLTQGVEDNIYWFTASIYL